MVGIDGLRVDIPAKTFLLGEYAVLNGHDALLLTSAPYFCFTLSRNARQDVSLPAPFHPDSMAGQLWQKKAALFRNWSVFFADPYRGLGGMGRSAAEFIGVWFAIQYLQYGEREVRLTDLMQDFMEIRSTIAGVKPSGVDVIAQCVCGGFLAVQSQGDGAQALAWPFKEIEVVLLHTRKHCVTAKHLSALEEIPMALGQLSSAGLAALQAKDAVGFFQAIHEFSQVQAQAGLLAGHTAAYIARYSQLEAVYAVRGCGAMGADVLAVFCKADQKMAIMAAGLADGLLPLTLGSQQAAGAKIQGTIVRSKSKVWANALV